MAKKMLIDATHAEETRVVVVDGNRVDEFDFESVNKRQLAGNIYLAKVTRVEPSLQAAFVDYGGNRHGFLAFSEIHPDYYQIPVADREALLAEERAAVLAEDDDETEEGQKPRSRGRRSSRSRKRSSSGEGGNDKIAGMDVVDLDENGGAAEANTPVDVIEDSLGGRPERAAKAAPAEAAADPVDDAATEEAASPEAVADAVETAPAEAVTVEPVAETAEPATPEQASEVPDVAPETAAEPDETANDGEPETGHRGGTMAARLEDDPADVVTSDIDAGETPDSAGAEDDAAEDDEFPQDNGSSDESDDGEDDHPDQQIETVAEDDVQEEIERPRKPRMRRYKIQEVVKVRQIMLVQVVKEERGNKGAALTTYLSLAGRYCVLMPNTARGGGISRKITNATDRKKLKEIAGEMDVPEGAGLIIRTAGSNRTKAEIKRDYEYLKRMWEQIRELTLKSIAPAPIYEEGNLIKRSIRDLYSRDIDEVLVEGEEGYRVAKDFMKMIMPSHAKNVKHYTEALPLFARFQIESYLAGMFNPVVQLRSGGYIVIGVTEALVAIDVNSGRATKKGSIEETALETNLEAAEEIARQLRLRDLAGLIVIDFIDMEERRNNASVEKRFKERLKTDRARIQVGRISGFGLLEMSRQRLRPGMLEATTQPCSHCHGTGLLRSDDSIGLQIIRQLEEEGGRKRSREVVVRAPVSIVNFLMNQKREHIAQIETEFGLAVRVEADALMIPPDFTLEKLKTATRVVPEPTTTVISVDSSDLPDLEEDEDEDEIEAVVEAAAEPVAEVREPAADETTNDDQSPKKRRRRRRRRRGGSANGDGNGTDAAGNETWSEDGESSDSGDSDDDSAAETEVAAEPESDTAPVAEPVEAVAEAPVEAAVPVVEAQAEWTEPDAAVPVAEWSTPDVAEVAIAASEWSSEAVPEEAEIPVSAPVEVETANAEAVEITPEAAPAPAEGTDSMQTADAEEPVAADTSFTEQPKPKRRGWWSA
ncbi:ribonuclease E/G [Tropicimonas sp. IMCC34043]|uniref:Rne/Rng family ribonuclease n=1 Tax=Tropicimonas sp. IMCC34043 TaxID=2248760 RepID=UPI000E27CB69|nr:ribonuclease E/G [Tropicimonas sp. IMCC34043]